MKRVVIDPGHGGSQPGAVYGGVNEKDITLNVCNLLAQMLQEVPNIKVTMTRFGDTTVSLGARVQYSNKYTTDFFISIHCNAADSTQARGMEIWTSPGKTGADQYATKILEALSKEFPEIKIRSDYSDSDSDKEGELYVITRTIAPAVLLELEFMSNPDGLAFLVNKNNQERIARTIKNVLQKELSEA